MIHISLVFDILLNFFNKKHAAYSQIRSDHQNDIKHVVCKHVNVLDSIRQSFSTNSTLQLIFCKHVSSRALTGFAKWHLRLLEQV